MARYIDVDPILKDMCSHRQHSVPFEYLKSLTPARVVPTPRWISVKERLPEKLTEVIAYDSTHKIVHAMVYDGEGFRVHRCVRDEWIYDACITHWMPLPEPPKEEQT